MRSTNLNTSLANTLSPSGDLDSIEKQTPSHLNKTETQIPQLFDQALQKAIDPSWQGAAHAKREALRQQTPARTRNTKGDSDASAQAFGSEIGAKGQPPIPLGSEVPHTQNTLRKRAPKIEGKSEGKNLAATAQGATEARAPRTGESLSRTRTQRSTITNSDTNTRDAVAEDEGSLPPKRTRKNATGSLEADGASHELMKMLNTMALLMPPPPGTTPQSQVPQTPHSGDSIMLFGALPGRGTLGTAGEQTLGTTNGGFMASTNALGFLASEADLQNGTLSALAPQNTTEVLTALAQLAHEAQRTSLVQRDLSALTLTKSPLNLQSTGLNTLPAQAIGFGSLSQLETAFSPLEGMVNVEFLDNAATLGAPFSPLNEAGTLQAPSPTSAGQFGFGALGTSPKTQVHITTLERNTLMTGLHQEGVGFGAESSAQWIASLGVLPDPSNGTPAGTWGSMDSVSNPAASIAFGASDRGSFNVTDPTAFGARLVPGSDTALESRLSGAMGFAQMAHSNASESLTSPSGGALQESSPHEWQGLQEGANQQGQAGQDGAAAGQAQPGHAVLPSLASESNGRGQFSGGRHEGPGGQGGQGEGSGFESRSEASLAAMAATGSDLSPHLANALQSPQNSDGLKAVDSSAPKSVAPDSSAKAESSAAPKAALDRALDMSAQLQARGGGTARIDIRDPRLGSIQLQIRVGTENKVYIEIGTTNSGMKAELEKGLDSLRKSLDEQKLDLADFKVSTQVVGQAQKSAQTNDTESHTQGQQSSEQQQQQQQNQSSFAGDPRQGQGMQGWNQGGAQDRNSSGDGQSGQPSGNLQGRQNMSQNPGSISTIRQKNVQRGANGSLKVFA